MEVQKLKYEVEVFVPFLCLNLNQDHLLQCLKFWSLTAAKIYIENQVWLSLVDTIWSENNSLVIFKKEICWDHWDSKKALWACAQEKRVIFSLMASVPNWKYAPGKCYQYHNNGKCKPSKCFLPTFLIWSFLVQHFMERGTFQK